MNAPTAARSSAPPDAPSSALTAAPPTPPRAFTPKEGLAPGTGLSYLRAGSGEPVVLLHGLAGAKELWWSTMRALAPSYDVLALDWPRSVREDPDPDGGLLQTLARLTIESCTALGIERPRLVGPSRGGNVAARAAIAAPSGVARLALVDAAVDARYLPAWVRLAVRLRRAEHVVRLNRLVLLPLAWLGALLPPDIGGGLVLPLAKRISYASKYADADLVTSLLALHGGSLGEAVRAIAQPTLVLTGAHDPLVHPDQARELTRLIPRAELYVLPGALHNPMDERPSAFSAALLRFLRAHPLPPAAAPHGVPTSREEAQRGA